MLRFIFLGTSSGVPTPRRNVSALAIKSSNSKKWLLIDAGEGTQQRLQYSGLSLRELTAVCITHVHGDHCYGLLGLLASAGMSGRREPLLLIAPAEILQWFTLSAQLTDLHLGYEVRLIDSTSIESEMLDIGEGISLQSHVLHHRVPCHAFSIKAIQQQSRLNSEGLIAAGIPKGKLWGQLQQGQDIEFAGQNYHSADFLLTQTQQVHAVIGGDNDQPELLTAACQQADVLVHEATFSQAALEKVGTSHMHSSAAMLGKFAQQIKLPNLILTHFSPRHHDDTGQEELQQDAAQYYQGQLFLAADFDEYELKPTAHLTRTTTGLPWENQAAGLS